MRLAAVFGSALSALACALISTRAMEGGRYESATFAGWAAAVSFAVMFVMFVMLAGLDWEDAR